MSQEYDNYGKRSLKAHKDAGGKIEIRSRMPLDTVDDLSLAYTPGVAAPCSEIHKDKSKSYDYTSKGNMVAVVSDGSAVLGLGNIGAEASLPVMEGKCVLLKKFAGIDGIPLVLDDQDTESIIQTVKNAAATFGAINLEDIAAPRCFEIERRLKEECSIPIFHDDQHGTAIVTLAGLINALRVSDKKPEQLKVVINGAGAAGMAILKLLKHVGVREVLICDSKGLIYEGRSELNEAKVQMSEVTNPENLSGSLDDAIQGADVFIGVSVPDVLTPEMVQSMNEDPIIFAMANPTPEIMPDEAHKAGARIIATGRSDMPNQINNVLAFPGILRGALNARAHHFTLEMFNAAAHAIADSVDEPTVDHIIPSPFAPGIAEKVADVVERVCKGEKIDLSLS